MGGGRGEGVGVQNPEGSVVVKKNRLSLKKKKFNNHLFGTDVFDAETNHLITVLREKVESAWQPGENRRHSTGFSCVRIILHLVKPSLLLSLFLNPYGN